MKFLNSFIVDMNMTQFLMCQGLCKWDPKYDDECRSRFNETGRKRLKGAVNEAARKAGGKKKSDPGWMHPDVYKKFLEKRKNPQFVKRSKQASLNKKGGEDGPTTHHYGSIKAVKHAAKMVKKNKEGKIPNAVELFVDTHKKVIDGKDVWSHPKTKKKYEEYEIRVRDLEEKGLPVDPNKIWFDLNNGFQKGEVFGLGTAAPMYYTQTRSNCRGKSSTSQAYIPGVLTQTLEAREREAEEFRKFREQTQQREEEARIREERIMKNQEDMRRQIENLTQMFQSQTQYQCNDNVFSTPRNPNDDNSGGGGIGGAGVGFLVN